MEYLFKIQNYDKVFSFQCELYQMHKPADACSAAISSDCKLFSTSLAFCSKRLGSRSKSSDISGFLKAKT